MDSGITVSKVTMNDRRFWAPLTYIHNSDTHLPMIYYNFSLPPNLRLLNPMNLTGITFAREDLDICQLWVLTYPTDRAEFLVTFDFNVRNYDYARRKSVY